jgi:hypothetical protein
MKANKTKNIVFSKLGEHGAYYKVENIRLQDKRFRKVYMNKK